MAFIIAWDETVPAGTEAKSLGDDRIRQGKYAVRERLAVDHDFRADETGATTIGYHKPVHLIDNTNDPTSVAGTGIIYGKTISGIVELFFDDSAGTVTQITTNGVLKINAVLLTGNQTIAGIKTFSSMPVLPSALQTSQGGTGATAAANAASGVVILDASSQLPAVSGALLTSIINSIYDYGTSASAYASRSLKDMRICYGTTTISNNATVTISNLPFTSSSSYVVVMAAVSFAGFNRDFDQIIKVTRNSGSGFSMYNGGSDSETWMWFAIGI